MDNSGVGPLRVPGFGMPISSGYTYRSNDMLFALGPGGLILDRVTKREIEMVRFMNAITDKPEWNQKIYDEAIIANWRKEARALPSQMISDAAFQWCIDELRDRAKLFESCGSAWVSALELAARVVKADDLVSNTLNADLRAAVQPMLESNYKDWHPGSNNQVLNLVHPSLFPLVYGKTRVLVEGGPLGLKNYLTRCGQGSIGKSDQEVHLGKVSRGSAWSNRFQWLPAEVRFVDGSKTEVKITSYINNLDPSEHHILYAIIAKLISLAIPLWNHVLIRGFQVRVPLRIKPEKIEATPAFPHEIYDDLDLNTPDLLQKAREYLTLPENPNRRRELDDEWERFRESRQWLVEGWSPSDIDSDDKIDDIVEAVEQKYYRIRHIIHPEPGNYSEWKQRNEHSNSRLKQLEPNLFEPKLEREFRDQGLQVIVKLSSIELTPDNPSYKGGNWHFEGMLNERIVGTAIYYYDVSNVTESRLRFRHEEDLTWPIVHYEQYDHAPVAEIYGIEHPVPLVDVPGVQEVGDVVTKEGRMLVFPNILQHKVEPFELVDKTKPGHRRFIVLWLVDPSYRIVSTANVPPQQKEWYLKELAQKDARGELSESEKARLKDAIDQLMDRDEAEEVRLHLMDERTDVNEETADSFNTYSLCEH